MENTYLMPEVLFRLEDQIFSIPSKNVQAIIQVPKITALPQAPTTIRGMIRYRETIYKLVDLRKTLGLISINERKDNFISMMDQRAADHKNWLKELENSVEENRPFKLATDPHMCKFGKWFDSFQTENYMLRELLDKFCEPHERIHKIAIKVEKLKSENEFNIAREVINKTKNGDLGLMLKLFGEVKVAFAHSLNELSIIIDDTYSKFALAVDSVVAVEHLQRADTSGSSENYSSLIDSDFLDRLSQRNSGEFVISLKEETLG